MSSHAVPQVTVSGDGVSVGEVGGVSTSATSQVTVCGGGMDEEDQGVDGEGGSVSVLGLGGDVQIEQRGIDEEEEEKVTEFCSKGCGCSMQCSSRLSQEHIRLMRANVAALDRTALDMTIVGQIMAFTNCSEISLHSSKHRHQHKEREKYNTLCYHRVHEYVGRHSSSCTT